MRAILLFVFLLAGFPVCTYAQDDPMCDYGETTAGARRCLAKIREQLEIRLVRALESARERALQPAALDTAQAKWIAFRESQCRAEAAQFEGGSLQPIVRFEAVGKAFVHPDCLDDARHIVAPAEVHRVRCRAAEIRILVSEAGGP